MVKYNQFILEKIMQKSRLQLSDNLINILKSMRSPLVSALISRVDKEVEVPYAYIDVDLSKNDIVTFIHPSKIDIPKNIQWKISREDRYLVLGSSRNFGIFSKLGILNIEKNKYYEPSFDDILSCEKECNGSRGRVYVLVKCTHSLDRENIGKVSVYNKDSLSRSDSNNWNLSNNKIKIGRFIKSMMDSLGEEYKMSDIESFVNEFKSIVDIFNDKFSKFDIVEGDDLKKFYSNKNYYELGGGTLHSSCMSCVDSSYFDLYTMNGVKLVILYDDRGSISNGKYTSAKITGRALLWETENGNKFMDRIYTINDNDVNLFKKFAEKNKWWCKKHQNTQSREFISVRGESEKEINYVFHLKTIPLKFPYLDTFPYISFQDQTLSNDNYCLSRCDAVLTNTNGSYSIW